MKYYTIDKKREKVLLYEYKALEDKLYEYKKRKMEEEKYKLIQASFYVMERLVQDFKKNEFNIIKSDHIYGISYEDHVKPSYEDQQLLEKFYRGEVIGEITEKFHSINEGYLLPQEIRVKKCRDQKSNDQTIYFTNDVIHIPESIRLLDWLERGNLSRIYDNIDKLDNQLDCFEFSQKPIDTIKLDTLKFMYAGKRTQMFDWGEAMIGIIDYTFERAEENQEILQLIKNK